MPVGNKLTIATRSRLVSARLTRDRWDKSLTRRFRDLSTTGAVRDSTQVRGLEFLLQIFNQHPQVTAEIHDVILVLVFFKAGERSFTGGGARVKRVMSSTWASVRWRGSTLWGVI